MSACIEIFLQWGCFPQKEHRAFFSVHPIQSGAPFDVKYGVITSNSALFRVTRIDERTCCPTSAAVMTLIVRDLRSFAYRGHGSITSSSRGWFTTWKTAPDNCRKVFQLSTAVKGRHWFGCLRGGAELLTQLLEQSNAFIQFVQVRSDTGYSYSNIPDGGQGQVWLDLDAGWRGSPYEFWIVLAGRDMFL